MSSNTWTGISPSTGWLLITGALLFWAGAVTPPYRQWMGVPINEYLNIIGGSPSNWQAIHILFALGSVITVAALGTLTGQLVSGPARTWSTAALALIALGMALWLVHVGFRLTVTPWAASELAKTGQVPALFEVSHRWMGLLFAAFMAITYLATIGFGLALLATAGAPRWLGWLAVVFGAIAIPGLATPVFQPPLMLFVVPFCIGVSIVRA